MIFVFVAAGIVGAAGLLVLGFGIPIKDTTFGNAMLLSSMVLLCTALILAGLGFVVRELKAVSRALAQGGVRATPRAQPGRPAPQRPAAQPGLAPPIDQGAPPLVAEPSVADLQPAPPAAPAAPPPWAAEAAARDRARNGAPAAPAPPQVDAAPEPPPPPPGPERPARRNLLFATRKRDRADAPGDASTDQPMSAELPKMAPPVLPPMTALEAEPKASFDSAWPAAGRGANPFARRSRAAEAAPAPPATPEPPPVEPAAEEAPAPAAPPPPAAAEPAPGVTVIKSGVVDGMAYSLYSDGSIEAQMPEGMLRFASLDELRTHLEQRS